MKFSSAQLGRVFVLRLEDGEIVHECIERFAAEHGIARAVLSVGSLKKELARKNSPIARNTPNKKRRTVTGITSCTRSDGSVSLQNPLK